MSTGFADLLSRFGVNAPAALPAAPVSKQDEVADATARKQASLQANTPNAEDAYALAAMRRNGTGTSIVNPIQRDMLNNNIWQNVQKYGAAAGDMAGIRAMGDTAFSMDRHATRSVPEAIQDVGDSVAGGAASGLLGIGAFGLGLVNDKAGGWAAQRVGDLNRFVQDNQSAGLNARRRANGAIQAGSTADSTALFEEQRKTNGDFVASLRRIGRDAVSAVSNATDDGGIVADGVANGVGSLLTAAPIAKGLSVVGKAALKGTTYAAPSLLFSERAAKLASLGSKAAMPASIGLQEAGGTYQQTYEEALSQLQGRDDISEDRKIELANAAATRAAGLQFPLAAATGIISSKFEAAPFHVPTLKSAAGNLIKETLEEGIQSGTSQLATNLGIRNQVNGNQGLSEGVGEQIGLGALYGLGTAGAVQAPGAAFRGAAEAAKLTGRAALTGVNKAVGGVMGTVNKRADAVTRTLENASPVAPAVMDQAYRAAVVAAPQVQADTVQAINEAKDVTPEQKAASLDYVDKFFNDVKFDPQEVTTLPAPMADILTDSTDRFDAIQRAAAAAVDENIDPETRLMSALYLEAQVAKYAAPLQDTIERIPDEHPALDQLRTYEDVMINLGSDIRVAKAVQVARDFANSFNADQVSDSNIGTPAGQNAAQNVATATSIDPTRVDPGVIDTVLKHSTQGKVKLTEPQRAYLQAAADLNKVEQEYMEKGGKLGLTNSEIVTRNIRTDKGNANSTGPSAAEHMAGVFAAVRDGKTDLARERMDELTNFTQSLQNKVAALNESLTNGDGKPVAYQAYNPKTKEFFKSTTPVFLNGRSENSIQAAQNMALDAEAVRGVHSSLARSFPQLGFASIEPVSLDADMMNQPADQAARAYRGKIQAANNEKRRQATADRLAADPRSASATQTAAPQNSEDRRSDNRAKPEAPQSSPAVEPSPQPETPVAEPAQTAPEAKTEAPQSKTEPAPSPVAQEEASPETQEKAPVQEEAPASVAEAPVEAGPVAQDDGETSDDETASTPIDATYPNLLGSQTKEGRGRNLFKQAFNLPVEAISRLTGVENPVQTIRDALTSGAKFRALVDDSAKDTKLTDSTAAAYGKLLGFAGRIGKAMNQQLLESLDKNRKFIESTPDWYTRKEYRALGIADLVDGKLAYNNELQQTSVLAGLQWMLQADQRQRPLKDEDVEKILGYEPSADEVRLFNQGLYYAGAVTDLTDQLIRYWGVRTNPDTGLGIVRGVPEGVAKELIRAMEAAGLLKVNSFKIGDKTYNQISFNFDEKFSPEDKLALMVNPTMIEAASMIEPEQVMFVGAPPEAVSKTQLRNPEVKLTPQQIQMQEKEQKTPYHVVPHMLGFLRALGPTGAVNLFGHGDIDNELMNESHKTSLTSINRGVYAAYDSINAMATLAEQKASEAGVDVTDMPIHYAYEFTSVNRLQMLGKQNPQSNKLTREIIMPTRSTLDLSAENEDTSRFWLAIAQAWGEKVHKQQRPVSVQKARDLAAKDYAKAIELLSSWLKEGTVSQALDLTPDRVTELKKAFNKPGANELKPVSPVAFYAAMEVARLNNTKAEDRKAFTTSLYVEADGITDGPMNAMVHTAVGDFTPTWLETMRKGGLYTDKRGATSNDQGNIKDLYQVTADKFKEALADLQNNVRENYPVRDSLNALIRTSGSLLGDLSYDPETNQLTDISRGAVKNPLTVVIYGAGDAGIANKIATTMVKAFYERLTKQLRFSAANPGASVGQVAAHLYPGKSQEEAQKLYQQSLDDIQMLTNTRVETLDGNLTRLDANLSGKDLPSVEMSDPKFEFTKTQMKNLQDNILKMMVAPLQEGIQANIGETVQGTTMLRQATQVQSIFLQYAWQTAVQKALDKREALAKTDGSGWVRSDFLSQKELKQLRQEQRYLSPFIQTGTQNMLISNSERVGIMASDEAKMPIEFARSLDGNNYTGGYMSAPQDAGVSGIPKMTISTGDGQMMQNFSTDADVNDGYMLIFDGANFRLTDVEGYSRIINKSVYDGWMQNPMAAVSKTFTDFINVADLNVTNPEQLKALGFALEGKRKAMKSEDVVSTVKSLQRKLAAYANDIEDRKAVLAQVQLSVDHMASAGASYSSSDNLESLEGLSTEQTAQRLNELLNEQRQKRVKANPLKAEAVTIIQPENLTDLVKATSLTGDNKRMFAEVVQRAKDLGYKIISGSMDQIQEYTAQNGLKQVNAAEGEQVKGYMIPSEKTVYIASPTAETVMHELIHAATIDQVHSYYLQDGKLSAEKTEAVARIEGLMGEWLSNQDAFQDLNWETQQAAENARTAIFSAQSEATAAGDARALNEFMAWVLSNQRLAQVAAQTKVKNPVARIVGEVLKALKNLLGIRTKVGDDILSNLRFNTQVLMTGAPTESQMLSNTALFQSGNFGSNDRLSELTQLFTDKIARHIRRASNPAAQLRETLKATQASQVADDVTTAVIAGGFPMDMQQKSAFQMMLSAFSADIQMDPNAFSRAQDLYTHVMKNLEVEDFMKTRDSQDPADRYQAQEKYDVLSGARSLRTDEQGRSTLVPSFMALATVNEQFRDILARMDLPKGEREANDGVDNIATNFAMDAMDRLDIAMAGERQNSASVRESLDALMDKISGITQDRLSFIDNAAAPVGNAIDAANERVIQAMQALSRKVTTKADQIKATSTNKALTSAADFAKLLAGVIDRDAAGALSQSVMSQINKSDMWQPAADLMNELIGRTEENADVYDMIKQVRSVIQSLRQQFREHLPELIQKQFSRELTDAEQTAMFRGLAKTDIAALRSGYSLSQVRDFLIDPKKVAAEASSIERSLAQLPNGKIILEKAKQLSLFLNTGKPGGNLLRNAYAIGNLFGTGIRTEEASSKTVMDIDHLVSLYALEGMNQEDRITLASLVRDEANGVNFVLAYLEGQRKDELAGTINDAKTRANHYKGYAPSEQQGGISLIVADDADFVDLKKRGYERVADYEGADAEYGKARKGYYFSPLSGRSSYSQGILQTVHTTVSGVNPATGFTTGDMTAGRITNPATVDRITKLIGRKSGGKEQLMPVFDETGKVVAYERSVDPDQISRLNKSTNLSDMLGAWRGRQAEETLAGKYNEALIDKLHDMWDTPDRLARKGEFINVLDKRELAKDPVLADAVKLIPYDTLSYIGEKFNDGFWVRRDMLNDSLGYRQASIGDAWTGITRWSPEVQKGVQQVLTSVFGADAFKRAVQAETFIMNRVTDARVAIVVKSIVVPVSNMAFNIVQLSARGVPISQTIRNMPKKTSEVNSYVKSRLRKIELEGLLRAASNDVRAQRQYTSEIQSIEDSWKRLSIWPLIEAGEFTSVSDVGIGKEDIDISEGRMTQVIEQWVDRMPDGIRTAAKYAIVSKDTALFKGLQKMVEYGDFLAKAVLYDDLIGRQKMTKAEALGAISEEYVNYDRLPGRARNYADNIGMLWFWNFKVRSTKVALSMIRNNPVHALFSTFGPAPLLGEIGSPLTDNIIDKLMSGSLGNSIGPGQAFRAVHMLPWLNLVG